MTQPDEVNTRMIEQVVRRYLTRVGARYLPFALATVMFLLMVAFVPTTAPSQTAGDQAGLAAGPQGDSLTGTSPAAGQTSSTRSGQASSPGGQGSTASTGPGSSGGAAAVSGPVPAAAAVGQRGRTASGGQCRPGVRQVPWTKYSTMCVPSFHGNNGGATARGVTGKAITVSFRISDSGEAAAVSAAAPSLNTAGQHAYFEDLQTYMAYFSKQFELYGRQVVLKEFTGKGDWVQEYQDQNLQAAQADADTARDMGAFADISTTAVSTTAPYAHYLAQDHVLSVGGVAASQHFLESNAPYVYTALPSISNFADWVPGIVCQRMKGLPAVFAGDTATKSLKRSFGLVYPSNPDWQLVGRAIASRLKSCGAEAASTYEYAIDISTMARDSTSAMAQMRAKGVTTVVCLCDTVVPRFLSQAADGQNYHPEWVFSGAADSLAQNYSKSQWSHAIAPTSTFLTQAQSEAYHVYQQAARGKAPASIYYYYAYTAALLFYNALQNAGPQLTPASFERGFFALPASLPGAQLGPWGFGRNHFSAPSGAPIGWFDTSATSNENGAAGAWKTCAGADGAHHAWAPYSSYGSAGTQLHCFGK